MVIRDEMLIDLKTEQEIRQQRMVDYIRYLQGKTIKDLNLYDLTYLCNHFQTIFNNIMNDNSYAIRNIGYWFKLQENKDETLIDDIPK